MIKSIRIKSFKCYEDSKEIQFSNVNLLTGLNGRGKSTVLQSLLALSQSTKITGILQLDLNGKYVRLGDMKDVLCKKNDAKSFSFDIHTDDAVDSHIKFIFGGQANEKSASIEQLLVDNREMVGYEKLITSDGKELSSSDGEQLMVRSLAPTSDIVSLKSFRNVCYISADRTGPVDAEDYVNPAILDSIGPRGEYVLNLLESKGASFQEDVRKALSDILTGANLSIYVENGKVVLKMDSSDCGPLFKPTNVGYGYGYLLSVIVAVLSASEKSILIIENPEAHIHPGAQSKLMAFLYRMAVNKGIQLFIETHSDHIINATMVSICQNILHSKDVRVLFFDKGQDNGIIVNQLKVSSKGRILYPPTGFFDQIDRDLNVIVGF